MENAAHGECEPGLKVGIILDEIKEKERKNYVPPLDYVEFRPRS